MEDILIITRNMTQKFRVEIRKDINLHWKSRQLEIDNLKKKELLKYCYSKEMCLRNYLISNMKLEPLTTYQEQTLICKGLETA